MAPAKRFVRFLIAGGVNTLFGFLVYCAAIFSTLPVWLALLVGLLGGIIFNFLTTGGYVFRDLTARRFLGFAIAYLLIYVVNLGLATFLSRWIDSSILIQAIVTPPMALGSYLLLSRFVFHSPI